MIRTYSTRSHERDQHVVFIRFWGFCGLWDQKLDLSEMGSKFYERSTFVLGRHRRPYGVVGGAQSISLVGVQRRCILIVPSRVPRPPKVCSPAPKLVRQRRRAGSRQITRKDLP